MGKLVCVTLADLKAAGVEVTITPTRAVVDYVYNHDWGEQQPVWGITDYVIAILDGKRVGSYSPDSLTFDCLDADSPNNWIREYLIQNSIPFTWN